MTENQFHFHLPLNPLLNVLIMVMLFTGSILMPLVEAAQSLVPFAQIVACAMTVFVGYRTLKKLDSDSPPKEE
jgi:hypothetical protein